MASTLTSISSLKVYTVLCTADIGSRGERKFVLKCEDREMKVHDEAWSR
jgi:hypothetical protein